MTGCAQFDAPLRELIATHDGGTATSHDVQRHRHLRHHPHPLSANVRSNALYRLARNPGDAWSEAARAGTPSAGGRDALVVHCAASGLQYRPMVPIWEPDRIRLQTIRVGVPCFADPGLVRMAEFGREPLPGHLQGAG